VSDVAIVVPWRPGVPDREKAWGWARPWWERFGWPIFEVEHTGTAPFSRSWCINEGARRAWPWKFLVIIDADVFEEDPEQVLAGLEACKDSGRLTIPHTVGADLNARGTSLLLQGCDGWQRSLAKTRKVCPSRVWIMPRDLFAEVGGFDERFRGWGHEDVAAFDAFRTLRGVDQFPGTAYHLWHAPSFPVARRTPEWKQGQALADRYVAAARNGWPSLGPILDERAEHERWIQPTGETAPPPTSGPQLPGAIEGRGVDVIVLTAGRQQYLERTLASFDAHVTGDIRRKTIYDDSGDETFGRWLELTYRGWSIVHNTEAPSGFTQAIRKAWSAEAHANGAGAPYIFHLEEDFVFDRDVDLDDLIQILELEPRVAQAALLRGPFFPPEIEAGGIVEEDPNAYTHHHRGELRYLVHRKFFTTNPCVYRRKLLRIGWPASANSETRFTRLVRNRGYRFAFIGNGEPWVSHIGAERTNRGY
jgi:hypothetical protein